MFTLPAGFRPAKAGAEPGVLATGAADTTAVVIESNGGVSVNVNPGDIFGLDGISFRCSPSGVAGCP